MPTPPRAQRDRVRRAYPHALDEATSLKDGKLRVQVLIGDLRYPCATATGGHQTNH